MRRRTLFRATAAAALAAVLCMPAIPVFAEATAEASPAETATVQPADETRESEAAAPTAAVLATPAAAAAPAPGSAIYVDGNGPDTNPGTEASPVATFERAKELLEASGGDTIYVLGPLNPPNTAVWDLGGKTLKRAPSYQGSLVFLNNGSTLTLSHIVVDGASEDGAVANGSGGDGSGGSLFTVPSGATLTIGEDATLQNNKIVPNGSWNPGSGGAVFTNAGTVILDGGTIRNNQAVWGGGIAGTMGAKIEIRRGSVTGNAAVEGNIPAGELPAGYGGTGGGILASNGTAVDFSGGTISDNTAAERGGGIAVGTLWASTTSSPTLTMRGGTISGNTAGTAGGGIFVQAGFSAEDHNGVPTYGIATITAGTISGNRMTGEGLDPDNMFGGGGIYVDGYSHEFGLNGPSPLHNGEVRLSDVEISGNSAAVAGGAYAACPVSDTRISLTDGSVIFGNTTANGNARSIYILASDDLPNHNGSPSYEISPSMLGGGAYRWVDDAGNAVPLNELKGKLDADKGQSLSLSNDLSAESPAVENGLRLVRVRIVGNSSATRGGGIGSNGTVFIGSWHGTTSVAAKKVWAEGDDPAKRPASIDIELYRDNVYVGFKTVVPDAAGVWQTTFSDLPATAEDGHAFVYTVQERPVEGYDSKVEGTAAEGYTIVNTKKPEPNPKPPAETNPPVHKDERDEKELPETGDTAHGAGIALAGIIALGASALLRRNGTRA